MSCNRFLARAVVALVIPVLALSFAVPARADLSFDTELTYTADVEQGSLSLLAEVTLTNLTPDESDGIQIIRYFYDHVQLRIPATAQGFRATSGGVELEHSLESLDNEDLLLATVSLGRRLFYQEEMELQLEYAIPGDPPRSPTVFRLNPAYISFGVAAWGEAGRVRVNVVAPASFDLRVEDSDWDRVEVVDDNRVYTVSSIAEPESFFIHVRGYNDDALASHRVDIPGFDVVVRPWPDDEEWAAVVTEAVRLGLPELQNLVGLEWWPESTMEIRESADVTLAGYGGWYLHSSHLVEVGEWADAQVVLHELSHTWFNPALFSERWIQEGLAEEYATRAAHNVGLRDESRVRPRMAPTPSRLVGPLNNWVIPTELETEMDQATITEYESYGYRASFWVVQQLVDEIGVEGMSSVLEAAASNTIAYLGAPPPEPATRPADWRRFLDLVQELAGSEQAEALFQTYVTDEDLSARAEARAAYQELTNTTTGWHAPYYVRHAMSAWDFDAALDRIDEALSVVQDGEEVGTNYTAVGLEPPRSLQEAYEKASESMDEPAAMASQMLAASEAVVSARQALEQDRGLMTRVGLIGSDLDSMYRSAREDLGSAALDEAAATAAEVVDLVDGAERRGVQRTAGAGGLAVAASLAAVVMSRRRQGGRHRYAQKSRHQIEIDAPPEAVWDHVRQIDLAGPALVRFLLVARGFRMEEGPTTPESLGFTVLSERPPRHLILGMIGKFWTRDGGLVEGEPEAFAEFNQPGYAKAVWVFQLNPLDEGRTRLITETRVQCTDAQSRRKFRRYWMLVGPFSALIRRRLLRSIRNQVLSPTSEARGGQS